jgi:hypothetical protein
MLVTTKSRQSNVSLWLYGVGIWSSAPRIIHLITFSRDKKNHFMKKMTQILFYSSDIFFVGNILGVKKSP